jgi:lactate permease
MWNQVTNPFGNIFLSALVAVIPIIFIFWALIIKRMKGYKAILYAMVISVIIAFIIYKMPIQLVLLSSLHGALYGLFPICWLILNVIFLFNITVKSGKFDIIRHFMSTVSDDRRIQALLIAFSFGAFLEGTAGFGAPVAISAAMLIGLGYNPLYAAGICLIANTSPVAFGSIGIPITVASQVSGIPEMAISQMIGRTLPVLSLFLPFYLVVLICGVKKSLEVWPAILVAGVSFAFFQWLSANYLGPMLPDVIAGVVSMASLMLLLRFWRPKNNWRFKEEPAVDVTKTEKFSTQEILSAWSPFIILTLVILTWGLQPVKSLLDSIGLIKFEFPGLHNMIIREYDHTAISQVFKINLLSTSGTAILFVAIISVPLVGLKFTDGIRIFKSTLIQLRFPILTIAAVLGFAYLVNNSGISITIADALASTGFLFPFFAPILGWLGVFITGSDTSSNALFGKLQFSTARSLGIDPVVSVAANCSGGVAGKMISPQSIAVATAATNLIGRESELFRFTVKHSFILVFVISIIVLLQSYVFTWLVPKYSLAAAKAETSSAVGLAGYIYLVLLFLILVLFISILKRVRGANDRIA